MFVASINSAGAGHTGAGAGPAMLAAKMGTPHGAGAFPATPIISSTLIKNSTPHCKRV